MMMSAVGAPRAVQLRRPAARRMPVRMNANPDLKKEVEAGIKKAQEVCADGSAAECAAEWDAVEEMAAEVSHKAKAKSPADPLEAYCAESPEADECRLYEE